MLDSHLLIIQMAALGLCLWLESLVPFYMDRSQRVQHGVRNLLIGLANGTVLLLVFSGLIASAAHWGSLHPVGLLHHLPLPEGAKPWVSFIVFDLWMYFWHRANHKIPFLWRFHRVHHADSALDATSGYRFHVGEMVLSTILRLAVIPLLGITLQDLLLYELILQPVVLFHHSNINLPERLDRWMRAFFVSPNMHRIHHSDIQEETDSNYASIFSVWDRLSRTYRRRETATILFGLKEFRDPRWQTVRGMLTMPTA